MPQYSNQLLIVAVSFAAVKNTYTATQLLLPAKHYGSLNAADDASSFATIKYNANHHT